MWSQLLLCFLVGLTYASPAWKQNTEYTYEVRGRSLSSLNGVADYYSGIVLRAKLVVQSRSDNRLRGKILHPEYAEVQIELPSGWMSKIPDAHVNYKPLQMTDKPFDVVVRNGVVTELIVDDSVPEWEANIIRSFVSQIHLDTSAEHRVDSDFNVYPKEGSHNAVFKTVEDTVTGIAETTYDIHPLPEYILQSEPHLAPFPHLKGDGSIIEILKNKNFTKGYDLPSYYFGFGYAGLWKPTSNHFAQISQRNSMGRAVITGTLQRYTIQYSETSNQIILSLNEDGHQKGSVNSMMRIQLTNAVQQDSELPELSSPVSLGSLVYAYGKHGSGSNTVSLGKLFHHEKYQENQGNYKESQERLSNYLQRGHPRSLSHHSRQPYVESSEESIESQEDWTVPKSKLNEAPWSPMLPFSIGYYGMPIKKAQNIQIVEKIYSIIHKMSAELQTPQDIPSEHTLSKYIILTSLLRTLNEQELKQISQKLYTLDKDTKEYYAWIVFRDCLAELGTGPAFLVIRYLIESKKLYGDTASNVIVTMERSVRQPSEEYMKAFYEMVKKQLDVQDDDQFMLNETMLFTFTDLAHKVYVNERFSHREYPTHSFGNFHTEKGKSFIKNEVVPYLAEKLRKAITNADAQKIQAYIYALGNVGHEDIVYVFEPYLEGKIQVSQFQRFMMVLALRHVADVYPKRVQPIFYRIYQNIGERMETRIMALYMLMHTNPSSEMLQRIAVYTNWEANHAVRAAVISIIESASKLEGLDFAALRSAAESAKPMLAKGNFGIQDSMSLLVSYASLNWASYYKHVLQTIVSEESGVPTSFYYAFEGNSKGLKYRTFRLESIVSDIRNLFHVFIHQTEWYQQQRSKQQTSQQSEKSAWSSHKIASLLNLKTEELEQLEGRLFLQIAEFKKHLIFNNRSLEGLPQLLEKLEAELTNGKKIKYTKLINKYESAIAFPTELGMPFLYTYDFPVFMHLEGDFKAKAQPKISSGNKLAIPEEVEVEGMFKVVLSGKKRTQFGLVTPFNHHQYVAGYEQNAQIYLPLKTMVKVDLKNRDVQLKVESLESENHVNIFHKSSFPYIAKYNILNLETLASGKHTHIIKKSTLQYHFDQTFGGETVGMPFRVRYESDGKYSSIQSLLKGKVFDFPVPYENIDVQYMYRKSQNKELKVNFKYVKQETKEEGTEYSRKACWERMTNLPKEDEQRISELAKHVSVGIPNAYVRVYDSKVEFSGQKTVEFIASLAYGRSYLRSKSRVLAYFKKQSQITDSVPFEGALSANINMARIGSLDLKHVMKSDPTSYIEIDAAFDQKLPSKNEAQIRVELKRSNSRKEYLKVQPYYSMCQREEHQGNKQLLACANMTQMAGLLDQATVKFTYSLIDSDYLYRFLENFNRFSPYYKFSVDKNRDQKYEQNEIFFDVHFQPDLQRVNVSVASKQIYASIKNIYVNEWARRVLVVHPTFDVSDRLQGKLYGMETYKPMCSMDKNQAYTFDGAEYPLNLSNYWTVILQYVPYRSAEHAKSSVTEQLKHELENYVVLARQSSQYSDNKEVKIVVSTPRTDGQVVEVEMKPTSTGSYPQVLVNGKQIPVVNKDKAFESHQGEISVVGLSGGEVYVEVRDGFYVIYDGIRFKITPLNSKLRNAIRGLCGIFDGRKNDDFVTPNNCIVREPKEFIASYTVFQAGEQNQEIINLKSRVQKNHCVYRKVPLYVNYISKTTDQGHLPQPDSCTKYQTRYAIENDLICFSIEPQSTCKTGCRQDGTILKSVGVHCVDNRNVASLWKSQIDKGASPDFSEKPVTKAIQMEVPKSCRSM